MKFKELEKDEALVSKIKEIYNRKDIKWDNKIDGILDLVGRSVTERTIRRWLVSLGCKERIVPVIELEQLETAKIREHDKTKKFFIITAAQSCTKINKQFWENLKKYTEHINGELLVIPYRYRNPTVAGETIKEEWWDGEIQDHLTLNRHHLCNQMVVLSDVKIQPTASMPLNSLENMTGEYSCIVGHPRVHLKSLPVYGPRPKIMMTTGNLTKPNFSDSKIGKISEFHMTYGAVIVEVSSEDNDIFYCRQITASDNGNFNDLYWNVSNGIVTRNKGIDSIVKGDIHQPFANANVLHQSFNVLLKKLKCEEIFLHDLVDFKSINHHESNNFIQTYRNEVNGYGSLKKEIDHVLEWLKTIKHMNICVVRSNHDDFLEKFIIQTDIRKYNKNTLEYFEYATVLLEGKAPKGLLAYIIEKEIPEIKCLALDDVYIRKNHLLSSHGSVGISGSRGNIKQFKSLNIKMISGHGHDVSRMDGAAQVGCNCELDMGYNHGPSKWVHGDIIIHHDSKIQHILYLGPNSEFTLMD
jgi:hypothetical protein